MFKDNISNKLKWNSKKIFNSRRQRRNSVKRHTWNKQKTNSKLFDENKRFKNNYINHKWAKHSNKRQSL